MSSFWQPLSPQYNQLTTSSPHIQPPPLNQQQIIHIHELPQKNPTGDSLEAIQDQDGQKINTNKIEDKIPLYEETNLNEIELDLNDSFTTTEFNFNVEYDNEAEASDSNATETPFEDRNDILTTISLEENLSTNKRSRRTTPQTPIMRRAGSRRPVHDYIDRNSNRRRPIKRRTTTPSYDYIYDKQANRRRKRPTMKTKNRPNRRPVDKEPEFYDTDYEDDEYDDYYSIARQEETTTDTSTTEGTTVTTTTAGTTTTASAATEMQTNATYGYTYGPPIQSGYGPPDQTGYGPSNGNEYISITYPPMTGPNRDALAPLLDSLYSQYSKNSIIKRLQELLQPNNFYNNQQYDVNYPENF